MTQEVNPTVSELVLQICGISEFLAKPSSMITVHMTNDVDGSQKIIKTPEISDFLAKPWQQIFDFRVGWIYLPGHLGPRLAGLLFP